MQKKIRFTLLGIATAIACASCGGGGSTTPSTSSTAAISFGTVTGFGSVFVNGVEFDTSKAVVYIEGQQVTNANPDLLLNLGMQVKVTGTVNPDGKTGVATRVDYEDNFEGPISSIDTVNGTVTVLGQAVRVDTGTNFEGTTDLGSLSANDVIEVSGIPDASGTIRATLIEKKTSTNGTSEIKGLIKLLADTNKTFKLGTLSVDYSKAALPDQAMADGMAVEVTGTFDVNTNILMATKVEAREHSLAPAGSELEVKGLIVGFNSPTDFQVNGQKITTTGSTRFENGDASALAADVEVEVEGSVNAEGVLVAKEIAFRHQAEMEVQGKVEAVDRAAGAITILGKQVLINNYTEIEDESSTPNRYFKVGDIQPGDYVSVEAYPSGNQWIATDLERKYLYSDTLPAEMQDMRFSGKVSVVTPGNLEISGITVQADPSTTQFRDGAGQSATADAFFTQAGLSGATIKVRGQYQNGVFSATRMEMDD